MFKTLQMTVNGKPVAVPVEEGECLLDTLRDRLGLTSVKRGCEVGECGACTVLIDGRAVDSCIYMSLWAEGKHILTVEGLKSNTGELGIIMSAIEIAASGKKYTRDELRKLISGHLCRCTGYENILNALERIAGANG